MFAINMIFCFGAICLRYQTDQIIRNAGLVARRSYPAGAQVHRLVAHLDLHLNAYPDVTAILPVISSMSLQHSCRCPLSSFIKLLDASSDVTFKNHCSNKSTQALVMTSQARRYPLHTRLNQFGLVLHNHVSKVYSCSCRSAGVQLP